MRHKTVSAKNRTEHCVERLTCRRGTLTRGAFSRGRPVAGGRPSQQPLLCSRTHRRAIIWWRRRRARYHACRSRRSCPRSRVMKSIRPLFRGLGATGCVHRCTHFLALVRCNVIVFLTGINVPSVVPSGAVFVSMLFL